MTYIPFNDFKKLDIRIGKIVRAEEVSGARKLLKLIVDVGGKQRQVVAGVAEYYSPTDLKGKTIVILVNLEPKKFMGIESQGMILAADKDGEPILLVPEKDVSPGTIVH